LALVTICIAGPGGRHATNIEARSSHEAARKGMEFFLDPFSKGPKPKNGTILRVLALLYAQV
jgi:hypothetical protein